MDKAEFDSKLERALTEYIPGCSKLVSVERLSGGASQETYRLNVVIKGAEQLLALRRSPGGGYVDPVPAHPGLAVEALLMKCALQAGVPAPEVFHVLSREDDLGDGIIMEWLEGEALGARIVRSDRFSEIRPKLAYEIGRILAKIHNIDLKQTGLDKKLAVIPPDEFIDQMWERYKLMNTPQPMIDYVGRWLEENLPGEVERSLVHNDFRNGNFMISREKVVAILDWEVAHIGDPMRDLGWICTNSWRYGSDKPVGGFGDYEDLFLGYEEVSGKKVDPEHVRFWQVFGSFWWAVGCLGFVEHYRTGPDQSVERPAVGRRSSECQVDCVNLLMPGSVELVPGVSEDSTLDMPRADELLTSVRDFLRHDIMGESSGRANFLARVASNSVDIVIRELALGPGHRDGELSRLREFFNSSDNLEDLRWRLVNQLRDGTLSLEDEILKSHLRTTVVNQIAIDQPKYSGFRAAISIT
ncbi:MAG: phosphotransferase [Gammaproteobacteria bacterium]|nr:phosphotransferase [Gammaproteobacteria bacterium]